MSNVGGLDFKKRSKAVCAGVFVTIFQTILKHLLYPSIKTTKHIEKLKISLLYALIGGLTRIFNNGSIDSVLKKAFANAGGRLIGVKYDFI